MIVHTRQPSRLLADLGDLRLISLMALLGGSLLSALVHPWIYVAIVFELVHGGLLGFPDGLIAQSLWGLAAVNLLVGYSVAMLLGVFATVRRGHLALLFHVLLLPVYWLAISLAAYRALYQLLRDPYLWEKTSHSPHSRKGHLAD